MMAQDRPQDGPGCSKMAPRWPKIAPDEPQNAPKTAQDRRGWWQDGRRWLKIVRDGAKIVCRWVKIVLRSAKTRKCCKTHSKNHVSHDWWSCIAWSEIMPSVKGRGLPHR